MAKPLKIKKVNIGSEEQPKFSNVGDYWDDESVSKITEPLQEYQELFPTKFLEMKGIIGDLGVMKIPLKPDARPYKQRPYLMNPKYKEKVQTEINVMLEVRIIELVKESEWISPIIIQEKKTVGEIQICVDLRKLNDACLHDPFPTPFTDEVLRNVGGQEMYSFTYGFLGYHQIRIAPKDCHKMKFATEGGCYQYIVMIFGLKNAPAIFSRVVVVAFKEYIHQFLEVYFDD